jgi:hypothetical protein
MNDKKNAPDKRTPAQKVIAVFGGVRATARILGRNGSTVSRWQKPRAEGGTGGRIPTSAQGPLLEHARSHGLPLTADDLIA